MLKPVSAAILFAIGSFAAQAAEFVLSDATTGSDVGNWKVSSESLGIQSKTPFTLEKRRLHGGKQEGVDVLLINNGVMEITLVPTRGMGIYQVTSGDLRLGWDSPVKEIVNPANIDLESRNGLGWLDGFNEMMVRCGYEWTGHPGVDDNGQLLSLHGRAQNTPASTVKVIIDEQPPYTIHVRGQVAERTFKKTNLVTWTELSVAPGSNRFELHDELTNFADYEDEYQIIYHSNFGTPILEEGASFLAPMSSISPFNDYAKSGLKTWQTYQGPTKDFDEMVFNIQPLADENHQTLAAVVNKAGDKGASIQFDTRQLPVLTLWKNTDTIKQGYVTGIEPGTSYAYPVTIEREQKRVKQLQPGASAQFDLTYTLLHDSAQVAAVEQKIAKIQGDNKVAENETPIAKE